jgi:rhamnulokinase
VPSLIGSPARVVAVDLGASSGRVYVADIGPGGFELHEVARFANGAVRVGDTLHWDILGLYRGMLDGLRAAARRGEVASVGIDSWAIDYGLLDRRGALLSNPVSHRDPRTTAIAAKITGEIGPEALYGRSGIALHEFNTVFQLVADRRQGRLGAAASALLIPDLLSYFLTGVAGTEVTNASTTSLVDLSGAWDEELCERLDIPANLFPALRAPGEPAGCVRDVILSDLGVAGPLPVTTVASHDTASAVVAVPAAGDDFAYISCGTWSLVGVEVAHPVVSEAGRLAGFTNEAGLDGTVRFLRNVMGLWLHQESVRTWERQGLTIDLGALGVEAAGVTALSCVVDPDDPAFLGPGDMPARIATACAASGQAVPTTPAEVTRCILDSLALAYRDAIVAASQLSGKAVRTVHLVGGGVHNRLLCQLTADACGLPVVAGPVEAAAIGNALVQARALGAAGPDLADLRHLVAEHARPARYEPEPAGSRRFDAYPPRRAPTDGSRPTRDEVGPPR